MSMRNQVAALRPKLSKVRSRYFPLIESAYNTRSVVEIEVLNDDIVHLFMLLSASNIVFTFIPRGVGGRLLSGVVVDYTQVAADS